MIIAVTGYIGSGKGVFANLLVEKYGFVKLAFRDEVAAEAERRGMEPTRENLQKLGGELRKGGNVGVWADKVAAKIEEGKNYVIEGLRYKEDAEILMRESDFLLIGIDAAPEVRCKRVLARVRKGDPKTPEEFNEADAKDRGQISGGQNTGEVFKMADKYITNNGTMEEFKKKIEDLVKELKR